MIGNSRKRHGSPPASFSNVESGSLASIAWHTASCGKSFRGDPIVLSHLEVMSVTAVLQSSSELAFVLRIITTNTIAAVRLRSCGTPNSVIKKT